GGAMRGGWWGTEGRLLAPPPCHIPSASTQLATIAVRPPSRTNPSTEEYSGSAQTSTRIEKDSMSAAASSRRVRSAGGDVDTASDGIQKARLSPVEPNRSANVRR